VVAVAANRRSVMAAPDTVGVELDEGMLELSQVGKSVDCDGFAYTQAACVGQKVLSVQLLAEYEHLQQIDLSKNVIKDVKPLSGLEFVMKLTLAGNCIEAIDPFGPTALKHLLHLDLSGNMLQALPMLHLPALQIANFARNRVSSLVDFNGHPTLRILDISEQEGGCLESVDGLCDMPMLENLDISKNSVPAVEAEGGGGEGEEEGAGGTPAKGVKSIAGLKALPSLKSLDISKNLLESLDGQWDQMINLQKLVLAENAIAALPGLERISGIAKLKELVVSGNPVEAELAEKIRIEALIFNKGLTKIGEEDVTQEERDEAKQTHEDRVEEERKRREEEEEAARVAAEEAAAAAEEAAAAEAAAVEEAAAAAAGE